MTGVTGNTVWPVPGSCFVLAVGIWPSSELAVSHVNMIRTLVAVILAIPTSPVGLTTGNSHILEVVVQKGVLILTGLSKIIDSTHCIIALYRIFTYMLNYKLLNPGGGLSPSTRGKNWLS